VNPLVTRIEAAGVARHGNHAGFFLHPDQAFRIRQSVRHGNLDHDMLAGAHALFRLRGMHMRGSRQDRRFDARLLQTFREIGSAMCGVRV
jgi:hypothetical protein